VESPQQVAEIMRAQNDQGLHEAGLIVANPVPADEQLDPQLHDQTLQDGLRMLRDKGIKGKDVTPALLGYFHSATQGKSLAVNVRIILRNAALAAQVAAAAAKIE
jgi:pseudouridine-5'-phosphate glycosidase